MFEGLMGLLMQHQACHFLIQIDALAYLGGGIKGDGPQTDLDHVSKEGNWGYYLQIIVKMTLF